MPRDAPGSISTASIAWRGRSRRVGWTRAVSPLWRRGTTCFRSSTTRSGGARDRGRAWHRGHRAGGGRGEASVSPDPAPRQAGDAVRRSVPPDRLRPHQPGALEPAAHPCPDTVRVVLADPSPVARLELLGPPRPVLRGD